MPTPGTTLPSTAPETAPEAVPRLGEVLTPEDRSQYLQQIEASLTRARRTLAVIERRTLTQAQTAAADQIKGIVKQADAMRKSDVSAAQSLAARAEVLARDLLRSLD